MTVTTDDNTVMEYEPNALLELLKHRGELSKGIEVLTWTLDTLDVESFHYWNEIYWLAGKVQDAAEATLASLSSGPVKLPWDEWDRLVNDCTGSPLRNLEQAVATAALFCKLCGKGGRPLRYVFEALEREALELLAILKDKAKRRDLPTAVKPAKAKAKKAQPRGCISAAPALPLAA